MEIESLYYYNKTSTGHLENIARKRSQASLLKPDTCFTESFREQALSSALYAELEERVHSDGEFADLLTTTMLNGKFFPKYLSGNLQRSDT